ncbi:hypothetical protein [Faecalibacillus faecis]|uniref:hypothetical protein n=1 Tax=Faecalibacillus faecis TaxID=1982628 RepID=UPI003AB5EADE
MNSIRIWLSDMNLDLAKDLKNKLAEKYLKDNVNVYLKEKKRESMSGSCFSEYSLIFTKPDEGDELLKVEKCSNDLSCMIRSMNEYGIFPSVRQARLIRERYKELLKSSELDEDGTSSIFEKE